MRSGLHHRFSIETSDSSVTAAIEQASAQVGASSASVRSRADRAWVALAALAMGDHDAGREAVRRLGDLPPATGSVADRSELENRRSDSMAEVRALYLLVAARCFAWTADHAFLLDEWPRIDRALAAGGPMEAHEPSAAIHAAALRELAVAAGDIGRPADTARLAQAATRAQAVADSDIEPALAIVLGGGLTSPDVIGEGLAAHTRSSAGDAGGRPSPTRAAMLIAAMVHGVVGAEPDAARHRLALRPCLPDGWASLYVGDLRVGDAAIAMRHTTDGARRTFTFEQVGGAVPLRLAFEPALPGSALRAVKVDGAAAQLNARPAHGRIVAPVQLVLDHERTVSFEY